MVSLEGFGYSLAVDMGEIHPRIVGSELDLNTDLSQPSAKCVYLVYGLHGFDFRV